MRKNKIRILHVAQAAGGVDRYIRMQKKKAENMMEFLTKNHKKLSCLEESQIVEPLTSLIRITTERTRPDNGERTN